MRKCKIKIYLDLKIEILLARFIFPVCLFNFYVSINRNVFSKLLKKINSKAMQFSTHKILLREKNWFYESIHIYLSYSCQIF